MELQAGGWARAGGWVGTGLASRSRLRACACAPPNNFPPSPIHPHPHARAPTHPTCSAHWQDVELEIQVLPASMDKAWLPNFIENVWRGDAAWTWGGGRERGCC